jgi:hypothetical protein
MSEKNSETNKRAGMETKISVKKSQYSNDVYNVTVTTKLYGEPETKTFSVETNGNGEGLWIDGRQVEGTSQFSGGKNPAAAIRRYFQKRYEY